MKRLITIFLITAIFLAIALIGAIVVLRMGEDTWICDGNQWIKHGNPESPMPEETCGALPIAPVNEPVSDSKNETEQVMGGDKDEHGCIGSAGYSWCPEKNKCLRIWEDDCPSIPKTEDN